LSEPNCRRTTALNQLS